MASQRTIVLVHGAFADASGFAGLIGDLEAFGYAVVAPPNPLRSLLTDADTIAKVVGAIDGPVVLAGHSYGGAVITQASAGLSNVEALVYLAAFGLDVGESCVSAQEPFPAPLLATENQPTPYDAVGSPGGPELYVKKERFREVFCGDSSEEAAAVMYATQRPLAVASLTQNATAAGWKNIPSWFVVSDHDNSISPKAEEFYAERMKATTSHVDGSHTAFIPRHAEIAEVIRAAAES
ncbi:alpha/beta hydrolase [Leifsonia shinshuensis]|uniref:Alpha/beta hydrolase n=1 Tax=Leifsonia shinshuensis TaxID=150026 RepID=A0A7G6YAL8_9MICO|nr:alpha/beta hydrolase [Leifsonia shinshuensis]QNE35533.1 alpha/beta hydrolase [Leifsonia shinshuensis]